MKAKIMLKNVTGGRGCLYLRQVLGAFLLLFFLPVAAMAAPAEKEVQLEAQMGWQGEGVPGHYAPAVVHLKNNTTRNMAGVIEAVNYLGRKGPVPPGRTPGTSRPVTYYPQAAFGEKVSLPAGSEKRVVLWFPFNGPGQRTDFVFRAGERELARIREIVPTGVTYKGPQPSSVGVLGEAPPALERVKLLMPDGVPRPPKILQLSGDLFPRRGEELNAFATILVTAGGSVSLGREQMNALWQWVQDGGHLIVNGGLEAREALAVLPVGSLPAVVKEIEPRSDWKQVARWLGSPDPGSVEAATARFAGEGKDWGPTGLSLGMQFTPGSGKVTVLSFDSNSSPWRAGDLGESLWQKFLAVPERDNRMVGLYSPQQKLSNLINLTRSFPRDAFPGWRPVGLFLSAFLLVAGPGVYLLLRRLRRPEYTWLAVPLLAVLFSGGAYLYMLLSGGNVLVNVVQVVDGRQGESPEGYTAVGYFAPTRAGFTAVMEDAGRSIQVQAARSMPTDNGPENSEPPYRVIRGSNLTVDFGSVSQFEMRSIAFRNNDINRSAGGLSALASMRGNKLEVRVKNKTELELDHVTVLLGDQYKVLGNLAPGEEARGEIEVKVPEYRAQGQPGPDFPYPAQIFMFPEGPPQSKPGMPMPPPPAGNLEVNEQRRAELMERWLESVRRHGPLRTGWPLTVVAWSNSPAGEVGIKELHRSPSYLSMFVLAPDLEMTGDRFAVPAGLVVPEVVESRMQGMFGHNNLVGLEGGSVTLAFKPHLPEDVKINEMTLNFAYFALEGDNRYGRPAPKPGEVPGGVLEVWHPNKDAWEPLSGTGQFTLPGNFASEDGEVKVRILGGSRGNGTGFYFLPPTMEFRGEVND